MGKKVSKENKRIHTIELEIEYWEGRRDKSFRWFIIYCVILAAWIIVTQLPYYTVISDNFMWSILSIAFAAWSAYYAFKQFGNWRNACNNIAEYQNRLGKKQK